VALRILITAGPTREYLDPVRYLSNDSSGRMGFALAGQAVRRGHRVTLVHGPVDLEPPAGAALVPVVSAAEMLRACRRVWRRHDVLLMAAAVADYAPARVRGTKLKKSARSLLLHLRPTPDVLAALSAERRAGQVVIGFALEDRDSRRRAAGKLKRKDLDAIVLNAPAAIAAPSSSIQVLTRDGRWTRIGWADKRVLAKAIVGLAERLAALRR
jgi:phosphopantothenoylcysteine decarboxylase/phosphopantothenate--cysteine ligase